MTICAHNIFQKLETIPDLDDDDMDIEIQSGLDEPEFVEGSSVCLFYSNFFYNLVLSF